MLLLLLALGCFPMLDLSPKGGDLDEAVDSGTEDGDDGDGSDGADGTDGDSGEDGDSGDSGDGGDSAASCPLVWPDSDGDGFGAGTPIEDCSLADGLALVDGDCDDADASSYPGAALSCDGADHDCDGVSDLEDGDSDGWPACQDGDDSDATIHPGAIEQCDGIDQDGDGSIDEEAPDAPTWYQDADGDGLGEAGSARVHCQPGEGWVENGDDCDDSNAAIGACAAPIEGP